MCPCTCVEVNYLLKISLFSGAVYVTLHKQWFLSCAHVRTFFGFKLFYCLWLLISTVQVRFQKDLENNIFNQLKCLSVIRWRFINTVTLWSVSPVFPHLWRMRRNGSEDLFCFKKLNTNNRLFLTDQFLLGIAPVS